MAQVPPNPWATEYLEDAKRTVATILRSLNLSDKRVTVSVVKDPEWNGESWTEGEESFIDVNLGVAFLAEDLFGRLLGHRDVWPEIGDPTSEGTPTVAEFFQNADDLFRHGAGPTYSRPAIVCPLRRGYAAYLSRLAWRFLVLHELGHVVLGHTRLDAQLGRGARVEPRKYPAGSLLDQGEALLNQALEADADRFSRVFLLRLENAKTAPYPFEREGLAVRTCKAMDIVRAIYGLVLLLCAGREEYVHVTDGTHPPPRLRQADVATGFEALIGQTEMLKVARDALRMDEYYPKLVIGEKVDLQQLRALLFDAHRLRVMAAAARARETMKALSWLPDFYENIHFSVPKQADEALGCIPSCALAVLAHLKVDGLPSEADLVKGMWQDQSVGSGFDRLRRALDSKAVVTTERLDSPGSALERRLHEGHYVLVALKGAPRAHCVVVETFTQGHVYLHDPGDGFPCVETAAEFFGKIAGDMAILTPKSDGEEPASSVV